MVDVSWPSSSASIRRIALETEAGCAAAAEVSWGGALAAGADDEARAGGGPPAASGAGDWVELLPMGRGA